MKAKTTPLILVTTIMALIWVSCYYPAINTGHGNGYEFSVGVSNTGWQFAFSGRNR